MSSVRCKISFFIEHNFLVLHSVGGPVDNMICTNMHIGETGSTAAVDGLTGAQAKILSRVGKLPKSARDQSPCLHFPFYRLTMNIM